MGSHRLNFGKAIYLGFDPLFAAIDGLDVIDVEADYEWVNREGVLEAQIKAEGRAKILTKENRLILRDTFKASPTRSMLLKIPASKSIKLQCDNMMGILCLKEYAAGGSVLLEEVGRIWSKAGRLLIISTKTKVEVRVEQAVLESHYFIMNFS